VAVLYGVGGVLKDGRWVKKVNIRAIEIQMKVINKMLNEK
jgi:hypothetical protein